LYRAVEPTSVTPFASPSRDRALHAALIILIRHACGLSQNNTANNFDRNSNEVQQYLPQLIERMVRAEPDEEQNIRDDIDNLIKVWGDKVSGPKPLLYESKSGNQYSRLMKKFGEKGEGWETLNSMRNVDLECAMLIKGEKER